jgi:hypothetical protein
LLGPSTDVFSMSCVARVECSSAVWAFGSAIRSDGGQSERVPKLNATPEIAHRDDGCPSPAYERAFLVGFKARQHSRVQSAMQHSRPRVATVEHEEYFEKCDPSQLILLLSS